LLINDSSFYVPPIIALPLKTDYYSDRLLDTYSHVAPGLQEAAAARFDTILAHAPENEAIKKTGWLSVSFFTLCLFGKE